MLETFIISLNVFVKKILFRILCEYYFKIF